MKTVIIISTILLCFAASVFIMYDLRKEIRALNREKEVHWILPKKAKCAIKVMYFRDSKGDQYPADRMVCHWSMI